MQRWNKTGFGIAAIGLLAAAGMAHAAQDVAVEYTMRLHQPQTQTVDIEMVILDAPAGRNEVKLPVWRPGRYVIDDYAGTIRTLEAVAEDGTMLDMEKVTKSSWHIENPERGDLHIHYQIYANALNNRTRHGDETHAYLSGCAVFLYSPDLRHEPARVFIDAPEDWRTATGLEADPDHDDAYLAPDYDILLDSPFEIGIHEMFTFDVRGVPHEFVLWGYADLDEQQLAEDITAIVELQADIFGDIPYERYVFFVHSQPGLRGGTEHWNSTIMQTTPQAFEEEDLYFNFLRLTSHETFHTWNVKRLRPSGITPYDYQRENYTRLLWFSEGSTSYYDDLTLVRADITTPDFYLDRMATTANSHFNRPGRHTQSLEDSSFDAWIKFNRPTPDSHNSTISFYGPGALASLMLDLEMRDRTDNEATYDDVMREMYQRFPLEDGGFDSDDLLGVINELTGSDFDPFFDRYIRGTEEFDLQGKLEIAGLELYHDSQADDGERAERIDLGLNLRTRDGLAEVSRVSIDGPAYEAGLIHGDQIVALNGRRLRAGDLSDALEKVEPGDTVRITFMRWDEMHEVEVPAESRADGRWRIRRVEEPTDRQREIYESWIGHPWPSDD